MNTIQIKSPKGGVLNLKTNSQGKSIGYQYNPSEAYLKAQEKTSVDKQEIIRNNKLGSIRHKKMYNGVAEAVVKVLDRIQISNLGDTFNLDGSINKQRKVF